MSKLKKRLTPNGRLDNDGVREMGSGEMVNYFDDGKKKPRNRGCDGRALNIIGQVSGMSTGYLRQGAPRT